ncbi:MAG TPA: M3 family metallopeptidase [Candidatus Saccharimonadales bacterium]|nr:M3 family metallopeptidase [Candidatus Saccharimonadales bacterium]
MTTPELLAPPPEKSAILRNLGEGLTPQIIIDDCDRMVAEAQAYLRQACGEATPADSADHAVAVEEQPTVLDAISRAVETLGLEAEGDSGIVPYLVRDTATDKDVRKAATDQQTRLQALTNGIYTDPQYEPAYQSLLAMNAATLDPEDQQRREYHIGRFEDARRVPQAEAAEGAENPGKAVAEAAAAFNENRREVATVELTPEEFNSLPEDSRTQLQGTEANGAVAVSLSEPNLTYLLQNGPRALRKRAWEQFYGERLAANDQLLETMGKARLQVAQAEGKRSWVEKQTEGFALGSPEAVAEFFNKTAVGVVERYQRSVTRLQGLLEADGFHDQIQEYDLPYYEKKIMEASYDMDEITFTLSRTFRGLLNMAEDLYGIKIEEAPDIPTVASDVKAYVVRDAGNGAEEGEVLGTFYADLLARKDPDGQGGKRDGSATYGVRVARTATNAQGEEETVQLPIAAIVANLAPPVNGKESPLTLRDIETVAHEFGHVLHNMFGRARGPEYGGDRLRFDVREIVSQAWEYLPRDPDILLQLANPGISEEAKRTFKENINAVQEVRESLDSMRILRNMAADLELHGPNPDVTTALERGAALMEPVGTSGHWIRDLRHEASVQYSGRYGSVYMLCAEQARRIVDWLRQNNYSPAIGRQWREILTLGGKPGAVEQLLAFANQSTAAAAGSTAVNNTL